MSGQVRQNSVHKYVFGSTAIVFVNFVASHEVNCPVPAPASMNVSVGERCRGKTRNKAVEPNAGISFLIGIPEECFESYAVRFAFRIIDHNGCFF